MDCSFKAFIEENDKRYDKGIQNYTYEFRGKYIVLVRRNREDIKVTTEVPEISHIHQHLEYDDYGRDTISIYMGVSLQDAPECLSCEVIADFVGKDYKKINIDDSEIEDVVNSLYKKKHIKNKEELKVMLKRYLLFVEKEYVSQRPNIFSSCGWFFNNDSCEYISITYRDSRSQKYIDNMIGLQAYNQKKEGKGIEEILCLYNKHSEFFDFLLKNKNLLGIFSYTIYSFLWDFVYQYSTRFNDEWLDDFDNKEMLCFSICINGKNVGKAAVIANILCNLFSEPSGSWQRVLLKPHISCTAIESKVDNLYKYSSAPIIVTSKTNKITKATRDVKSLLKKKMAKDLFVYPVYISDAPIGGDGMLDFSIDSSILPFDYKDKEKAIELHRQMGDLIYCFMMHLQDTVKSEELRMTEWFKKECLQTVEHNEFVQARLARKINFSQIIQLIQTKYELEERWFYDNFPICALYVCLRYFCDFLSHYGIEQKKLLDFFEKEFFCLEVGISDGQNREIDIIDHQKYLLCLKRLIDRSIKQKEEWLKVGYEPTGDKEHCYYLLHNVWYDKFYEEMISNKIPVIKKGAMVNILKDNGLMKKYKTSTANVMRRYNDNYLTIYIDSFEAILQKKESSPVQ